MRAKIPQSARDGQQPHPFATLLNQLFATRLSPEGRPYTLTEVSQATGISVPYLSYVRKGTIGALPGRQYRMALVGGGRSGAVGAPGRRERISLGAGFVVYSRAYPPRDPS